MDKGDYQRLSISRVSAVAETLRFLAPGQDAAAPSSAFAAAYAWATVVQKCSKGSTRSGVSHPGTVRAMTSVPSNPKRASALARNSGVVSASIGMSLFCPAYEPNGTMMRPSG